MKKQLFFSAVCLLMFAGNVANSMQGILLSTYIDHYGLESASQGLMGTIQSIGSVLICFVVLWLAGKTKRYHVMIYSACALCIPVLLISTKPPFALLLLSYFFIGTGYTSTSTLASSLTSEIYKGNGAAMGMLHGALGIGGLVAPVLLQAVLDRTGEWRWVCMVDFAIVFAVLIYYLAALRISRDELANLKEGGSDNRIRLEDLKVFFSKKSNILLLLSALGYAGFQLGVGTWTPRFADIELNAGSMGATMVSLFWIGTTVARLTITHIKKHTEILFSLGCLISAVALGIGLLADNAVVMLICIAIAGVSSGAAVPQLYHMGCTNNSGNSLIPTTILVLTMSTSFVITSPLTAALTDYGITCGMVAIAVYAFIGGIAMLPLAIASFRKQSAA